MTNYYGNLYNLLSKSRLWLTLYSRNLLNIFLKILNVFILFSGWKARSWLRIYSKSKDAKVKEILDICYHTAFISYYNSLSHNPILDSKNLIKNQRMTLLLLELYYFYQKLKRIENAICYIEHLFSIWILFGHTTFYVLCFHFHVRIFPQVWQ